MAFFCCHFSSCLTVVATEAWISSSLEQRLSHGDIVVRGGFMQRGVSALLLMIGTGAGMQHGSDDLYILRGCSCINHPDVHRIA